MASDDEVVAAEEANAQDQYSQEDVDQTEEQPESSKGAGTPHWLWNRRPWDAFKTFAIIFSFIMNFVLLIVLLAVGGLIIPIVNDIVEPIVGGLNDSFIDMSEATISQEIGIDTTMPISFVLPLELKNTEVVLAGPVDVSTPATFILPGGGGQISGQVFLTLEPGLVLPVNITENVPVDQEIPVTMNVPVEIPLAETELGVPFRTLRGLFSPLNDLLIGLPSSNEELQQRVINESLGNDSSVPEQAPQ